MDLKQSVECDWDRREDLIWTNKPVAKMRSTTSL